MDNQEILDAAKSGDIVHITLRGPATDEEIRVAREAYEKEYPGVKFTVSGEGKLSAVDNVTQGLRNVNG